MSDVTVSISVSSAPSMHYCVQCADSRTLQLAREIFQLSANSNPHVWLSSANAQENRFAVLTTPEQFAQFQKLMAAAEEAHCPTANEIRNAHRLAGYLFDSPEDFYRMSVSERCEAVTFAAATAAGNTSDEVKIPHGYEKAYAEARARFLKIFQGAEGAEAGEVPAESASTGHESV